MGGWKRWVEFTGTKMLVGRIAVLVFYFVTDVFVKVCYITDCSNDLINVKLEGMFYHFHMELCVNCLKCSVGLAIENILLLKL